MKPIKVLFISTSQNKIGDSNESTGVWLEELATPYYIFREAGADLTIASPHGGRIPLDPKSQSILVATPYARRFLKDPEAMSFLSKSLLFEQIKTDDFDVIFLTGGHGSLWDLADNKTLKQLLENFNRSNKPIGAVSHGVVGLLTVQDDNGQLLVKGKQLTCFSNSEEASTGLSRMIPFLVEPKLVSIGALYSKGPDYVSWVVTDGNIVTGQNPASSEEVAKKIIALVLNTEQPQQPQLVVDLIL